MNYIFLVNFIHFAGDGNSRPTAKGRYKYSNMKKKKNQKTTKHTTTLSYVPCVETFNPAERWLPFSAFPTFSESFFFGGGAGGERTSPSRWPHGFSGGFCWEYW